MINIVEEEPLFIHSGACDVILGLPYRYVDVGPSTLTLGMPHRCWGSRIVLGVATLLLGLPHPRWACHVDVG